MSADLHVRLYLDVTIRVPLDTTIDADEYTEWCEEGGSAADFTDTDRLLEFIESSPDDTAEYQAQFPPADSNIHEVMTADFADLEILTEGGRQP